MEHLNKSSKENLDSELAFHESELRELSGKTSELLIKLNNLSKFLSTEQNSESSKDIKVALPKVKNKESFSDLNEVQTPSVSYLEEHKKQFSSTNLNGKSYIKKTSERTFFQSNQSEQRKKEELLFDYSFKERVPESQKQINNLSFPEEKVQDKIRYLSNNSESRGQTHRIFSQSKEIYQDQDLENLNSKKDYQPYRRYVDTHKLKELKHKEKEPLTSYLRPENLKPNSKGQAKAEENSRPRNNYNSEEILENLNQIEKKLGKVSQTFRKNSDLKLDIIKVLAWLAPCFALSFPFNLIKLLNLSLVDNFVISISLFAMSLFFGIFTLKVALKIAEISEITNWSHKQIFLIKSVLNVDSRSAKNQDNTAK